MNVRNREVSKNQYSYGISHFHLQHRQLNGEDLEGLTLQDLQRLEELLKRSLTSVSKVKVCAPYMLSIGALGSILTRGIKSRT